MRCKICEINCDLQEGGTGSCGMYINTGTEIRERYPGRYLAAVDTAIESMPMVHYHPGGTFLQVCTVGCNFKCRGCVSEILTDHFGAIQGEFQEMTPEQIMDRAEAEACIGVMFCFNEPTVSYFTVKALAAMVKQRGLLFGCSTNGYMTPWALEGLAPYLDFVNIGIKGASRSVYRDCGVSDIAPVLRNVRYLHQKQIYFEISAIFRKSEEEQVETTARFIGSLSRKIPFQVMRFLPFGKAGIEMEPSVRESETLCRRLRRHLDYVYLFNTPGTDWLNTCCPDCGATVMERGFFGPMCANLYGYTPQGRCSCGRPLPIQGSIHNPRPGRQTGYFGGYRTISALNMIRSILGVLEVMDKACVDAVMIEVIKADFIKGLYDRLNRIDAYFDTVDYFASLTGLGKRAALFREYVMSRVDRIRERTNGVQRRPVYCSLGHPLIAMFEEKMESRLVETAGGRLTNRLIHRESRPGITISADQFCRMAPEMVVISDGAAWPAMDFISYCTENGLDAPAVRNRKIYNLYPFRCSTNPDWILGLMALANIIHPSIFDFDLQKEADDFYRKFYGQPFKKGKLPAFPWEISQEPVPELKEEE